MAKQKLTGSEEVSKFLAALEHPLRPEIEELRKIILHSNNGLTELIKWNAPSFRLGGDDRITMRIHPPQQVQLVFHRGSKVQQLPKDKLITDDSGLLSWKTNDRAVATFKSIEDIKLRKADLIEIVDKWLKATMI
jgi:DNA-binding transcriptional ArsR family regulator